MKATSLLRHEIKSVDDYYINQNPEFRKNSFSDLQKTAICEEITISKTMKKFSFAHPQNKDKQSIK